MDAFTAFLKGATYRDNAPAEDPIHRITDARLLQLVENQTRPRPAGNARVVAYRDPTGQQAAARADRKRR